MTRLFRNPVPASDEPATVEDLFAVLDTIELRRGALAAALAVASIVGVGAWLRRGALR